MHVDSVCMSASWLMADSRKKLRLSQAKKGLVDGLAKLVHDAAGELVTNALLGLEESPSGRAVSAITPPVSGGLTESFRIGSSRMCNGQIKNHVAGGESVPLYLHRSTIVLLIVHTAWPCVIGSYA